MDRRAFLGATGLAGLAGLTALAGCGVADAGSGHVALVYRGPAACDGCAESVAALLRGSGLGLRVRYCGPGGDVPVTADSLARASIYAQPGGGDDVAAAWRSVSGYASALRDWVHDGGNYLGFCMGGYAAGSDPGFELLPGTSDEYTSLPGAVVHTNDDTVVPIVWRGAKRHMFFQDGPYFPMREDANIIPLATYPGGELAALVARYGTGRVGVIGPHPEADASWYGNGLRNPDGIRFDLGYDLIGTTLRPRGA